jgi:hypothetical protein
MNPRPPCFSPGVNEVEDPAKKVETKEVITN